MNQKQVRETKERTKLFIQRFKRGG